MASEKRFFGPLLSSAQHKSIFAGDDEGKRMSLVRGQIVVVRKAWQNTADYRNLLEVVRRFVKPDIQPKSIRVPIQRLLQGFHDYADIELSRPEKSLPGQYDALELYCSKEGYIYLFQLISKTLRLEDLPEDLLLTAVTLVEFLTIDLYNLRLSNFGDPRYSNFQGITYRGIRADSRIIEEYREVVNREDLRKRSFSIPLAPISTSTDEKIMADFAQGDDDDNSIQMHWKIHIHGIDPNLLQEYSNRYPDSIITSICSMPVGLVSPFGEKEILLRGVSFQLLRMTSEVLSGREVYKLEAVMINANRDHTTELGSNENEKKRQRDTFRRIAMASKYEVCASLALQYSDSEADRYRKLQQEMLDEIRKIDEIAVARNSDLADARSGEIAVWLGGTLWKSFPQYHARLRQKWQAAVSKGQWAEVNEVLDREYDWRRGDWYNITKLSDAVNVLRPGFTLLHELAVQGPPKEEDKNNLIAWKRIVEGVAAADVWKSLRTFDHSNKTAQEIAQEKNFDWLASRLKPVIRTEVSRSIINDLESQLHQLMRERAGQFIDDHIFHMPQLLILTELQKPSRLWIPIPHMYGGFLIELVDHALNVDVFEAVAGHVGPKKTTLILRPSREDKIKEIFEERS